MKDGGRLLLFCVKPWEKICISANLPGKVQYVLMLLQLIIVITGVLRFEDARHLGPILPLLGMLMHY